MLLIVKLNIACFWGVNYTISTPERRLLVPTRAGQRGYSGPGVGDGGILGLQEAPLQGARLPAENLDSPPFLKINKILPIFLNFFLPVLTPFFLWLFFYPS